MPKGPQGQKRPADVIGAAVMVARLATEENSEPTKEKSGRTRSGKAGAKARANKGGTPRDRKKGGRGEMEMKKPDIQREVDDNYEEFKKLLPTIIGQHRDKFALMKEKKVLGYFSTAQDAREAADSFVKDGVFSIQQVTDVPINLGFFTHAVARDTVQH